ncbi:hypothetical protein OE88DRAFT_107149 [Heliocybe sulcata]|uniref:REJ domain-containing protein n=1 Tax=Heliocybe sulcata TaxID=5364 RepID=A0A5C3NII6_9AGAM|nr:hypothetical protein OE88DRAFT_107149 [Heliocybe sulcata]
MSAIAKSLLVLSLALYATALAAPHLPRNSFEHHHLAARAPVPAAPVLDVVPEKPAVTATRRLRKRASGRCKASTSSSAAPSSTFVSSSSSSAAAAPSSVVNVAPSPSLATSSSEAAPTSSSTSKAAAPSTTAAPKTTATPTTSQAPAPATSSASSGGSESYLVGTQTGQGL